MINYCIDTQSPFGIVLLQEGQEAGACDVSPHCVGTAARITNVERLPDGRINIMVVGTQRFHVQQFNYSHRYLQAEVTPYPIINASTRRASQLAQRVRPKIIEYVDAISDASQSTLPLNKLPDDPAHLAFLIAMALRIDNDDKQKLLALPGVPEILAREDYLLWRETALLHHMLQTQGALETLSAGPTGHLFAN